MLLLDTHNAIYNGELELASQTVQIAEELDPSLRRLLNWYMLAIESAWQAGGVTPALDEALRGMSEFSECEDEEH